MNEQIVSTLLMAVVKKVGSQIVITDDELKEIYEQDYVLKFAKPTENEVVLILSQETYEEEEGDIEVTEHVETQHLKHGQDAEQG
jgi:hypothetical protein